MTKTARRVDTDSCNYLALSIRITTITMYTGAPLRGQARLGWDQLRFAGDGPRSVEAGELDGRPGHSPRGTLPLQSQRALLHSSTYYIVVRITLVVRITKSERRYHIVVCI